MNYRWDLRDAVTACCLGEFAKAIDLVEKWDSKLARDKYLHNWFEARLRLMAIHRLAGKAEKIEALAKPLSKAAQKARDWMTLRRLNRLLENAEPASPSAMLAAPRVGPFAAASVRVSVDVPVAAADSEDADEVKAAEQAGNTPLAGLFEQILGRLQASEGDEAVKAEILRQVLELPADAFADPKDAGAFLYIVPHLVTDAASIQPVWAWAEATAAPFPQHAGVLNMLATLADMLTSWPESTLDETVESRPRIESGSFANLSNSIPRALQITPEPGPSSSAWKTWARLNAAWPVASVCSERIASLQRVWPPSTRIPTDSAMPWLCSIFVFVRAARNRASPGTQPCWLIRWTSTKPF